MKYDSKPLWLSIIFITHTLFSTIDEGINIKEKPQETKKRTLDKRLYKPPTLKLRCLLALESDDLSSEQVPEELRECMIAFQNIQKKKYYASDLKSAFHLSAPTKLKKKVFLLDQRKQEKFDQTDPLDAALFDQTHLSVFDNLYLILESKCEKDINKGLIQLGRFESYKKRKVLYAILLNIGANKNYYGSTKHEIRLTTPLITATIHQHISCVELLLKFKANPHLKEEDGYTAYTLARRIKRNDTLLIELLRSYGSFFIPVNPHAHNLQHTFLIEPPEDTFAFACVLQ